jgi:lipopolysaccharide transport system permease protein
MSAPAVAVAAAADRRRAIGLIAHLARREVDAKHRWTLLGWAWPVVQQLAQLAILVFIFSAVLDLGIENYPVFVFSGLVTWAWFSGGLNDATRSVLSNRYLVFRGGFPTQVLPAVSAAVRLVDLLLALPILLVMVAVSGELHATVLFLPAIVAVQFVLIVGLGWLTAAASVYLRDVPNIVSVGLLMLFYLTPIFYDASRVPEDVQWVLMLNPVALLVEAYRDVTMYGVLPDPAEMLALTAVASVIAAVGLRSFKRLSANFVDEL